MSEMTPETQIITLLSSILDKQKETNRLIDRLTRLSGVYYEGMADRMYTLGGEPVLNVAIVSRYEDDN